MKYNSAEIYSAQVSNVVLNPITNLPEYKQWLLDAKAFAREAVKKLL